MEGDGCSRRTRLTTIYFNPLPPHGGRLPGAHQESDSNSFQSTPSAWRETAKRNGGMVDGIFQSTPSAWRETGRIPSAEQPCDISIHSLRMEGDPPVFPVATRTLHFNPLPPHGGRRRVGTSSSNASTFQSTPSAWRETFCNPPYGREIGFQSTPSAWRETLVSLSGITPVRFQSTPSAWRETS